MSDEIERRVGRRFVILLREVAILMATVYTTARYTRTHHDVVSFVLWMATILLAHWRLRTVIKERLGS